MQQQSNMHNKFLIDADIGDDDVTLPNLPAVDVPIVESHTTNFTAAPTPAVQEQKIETEQTEETSAKGGFFSRMKEGLTKTRRNLADGMVNILIGGKEIDDELLEEVEEQLLVADIGVEATKTIITNLTERTARGDLIYSHSLYKALQEELVALLAPRVKPLHIDPNKAPYVILMVGVNGVGKTTT
ncbi:signal recognition particle receptor subunit alpha, partial [uncultured Acinetobacter sp.]